MSFLSREQAGKELASELREYGGPDVVVLAIPRGGVVVASEIAKTINSPIDLVIPRKIGAPGNSELAIGAVVDEGEVVINEGLKEHLGVSQDYLVHQIEQETQEIKRRRKKYLGEKPVTDLTGKIAIVVDDGLATGYTALAAVRAVRSRRPKQVVLAVPVAPRDTYKRLETEVDKLVCLEIPQIFFAVGQFYSDFSQTSDEEVIAILSQFK